MAFLMGGSGCAQTPLYLPHRSLSSTSHSGFLYSRNARIKKRRGKLMASVHRDDKKDESFCNRRTVLYLGVSVFPFLQLKAEALDTLVAGKPELKTQEENQNSELLLGQLELEGDAPSNPILSLLNGIGIFGSGVLGALYALDQKDRTATNAAIESMNNKLKEKEEAILLMERNFESKLLQEQEEQAKQLKKAKEEQLALVDQLNSAKSKISGLGQEIKNEKRLVEELNFRIDSLQNDIAKAGEEKKTLEGKLKESQISVELLEEKIASLGEQLENKENSILSLSSSLALKEKEFSNLVSSYNQTKDELASVQSENKRLSDKLLKSKNDLEMKSSVVDELNARVASLDAEKGASKRKIDDMLRECNSLKSSSEKKAALDASLLGERESEIRALKEELETALNEVTSNQATILDLSNEKEELKKKLESELSTSESLSHMLELTRETLGKSREEASDMAEQLKQSRQTCTEVEAELSRVHNEFAYVRESLNRSLEETKRNGEVLAGELTATKEVLSKAKDELLIVSKELAAAMAARDSLQKELVEVYKRAETAVNDLKEEKQAVSSLKNDLLEFEKQIMADKKGRRSLEMDLEEATKSLDEMNRNALLLSRDLEKALSRISNLEEEKEVLHKSLTEQKSFTKEAQENLEDAHNLVMRLGKERDGFEERSKKLEEELASAKGEILRLRSQINSSRVDPNNKRLEDGKAEENVPISAKKATRRRRAGSQ